MRKMIVCRDCKKTFEFTDGEQAFYREHDLQDPTRCKVCRELKKKERQLSQMGGTGSCIPGAPVMKLSAMNRPQYSCMYCVNGHVEEIA